MNLDEPAEIVNDSPIVDELVRSDCLFCKKTFYGNPKERSMLTCPDCEGLRTI